MLSSCLCVRRSGLTDMGYLVRFMDRYHLVAGRVPMLTAVKLEKLSYPVWHRQGSCLTDTWYIKLLNMSEM